MVEFVAVDASKADQGDRSFLVGVAVEVRDGGEFDDYYFGWIDKFCDRYDIELAHNILKAKDVLDRVPSFSIREADNALIKGLVRNPAIRRIHVSIGWFDDSEYPEGIPIGGGRTVDSGIRFVNGHLDQYFPVATLWRYHREHPEWADVPDEAWIDNVQGRITKAWKYVGREFDINLTPHGDVTYPSLSTADLVANHLARTLPREKPFSELDDAAAGTLIDYVSDRTPRVSADQITHKHADHIVPNHRYSIQGDIHFPHPILFIYDEVFAEHDEPVLPDTDFHAYARKWAQENAGCVYKLQPHRMPALVESGDKIVYSSHSDTAVPETLVELNPSRDVQLLTATELFEQTAE
jgi:hypothetical protein